MRKAGDIIAGLLNENFGRDFMESSRTSASLFSSWEQLTAEAWSNIDNPEQHNDEIPAEYEIPAAAAHSRIRELEHGVLLVEADHPGWIQILQTKQTRLLEAVRRKYPELGIKDISFRLSRK